MWKGKRRVRAPNTHEYEEVRAGLRTGKLCKKQTQNLKKITSAYSTGGKSAPFSTDLPDLDCEPIPGKILHDASQKQSLQEI